MTEDCGTRRDEVPQSAWKAADIAYNSPEWSAESDELHQALLAASPHIRADELEIHLQALTAKAADTPLIGRKNNGIREGLDMAIQLLTERRAALLEAAPHDHRGSQ